jgi:hypothetical protein
LWEVTVTVTDKKRFAALMGMLAVAFDQAATVQRMAIYFDALRDLRIGALEWAGREAVARLKWFPKAAELRDLAGIAPASAMPSIRREERVLLEELEPPEVAAARLAEVAERLNVRYGTGFRVGRSRGRPVLVGAKG